MQYGGAELLGMEWGTSTLQLLTERSPDVLMVLDLDGCVEFINWTAPGLTVEQVLGTRVFDHVPEDQHAHMDACFQEVKRTGQPGVYRNVYLAPDGSEQHWESKVTPVTDGENLVGFSVFSRDVTERDERTNELSRFFELSLDYLCVASLDGYFTRVNQTFTRELGYSEEELLSRSFLEFVHPDDVEPTKEAVAQVAAGQVVRDLENRYRTKDGRYRLLRWHGRLEEGSSRILAVARDVTEQRALEKQLQQSQKMDAVGQLAGGIAHDFNNLMLAVLANAEFAQQELDAEQHDVRAHLQEIERAGAKAAALTKQLLAFSRRMPPSPQPVELNNLVREFIQMLRRLIPENIEVDFVPGYRLPKVEADPGQVEQVLMNLCVNAKDAMPDGGRLTIETEGVLINGRYRETHPWAKPGRYLLLSVTDTGCGMTADVKERLFEPFFSTKGPSGGTGLGLATAYAIIKQHGGLIHVYSEPNEGSSFKVYLPLAARRAEDVDAKKDEGLPEGRETILIAEDEVLVRKVIVQILERAGYRVLAASNGHEAVKLLKAHQSSVDLAILDVVMPELSGPETYTRLLELRPGLPVLFSSGYTDGARFERRVPPDQKLLAKPYRSEDLLHQVRVALAKN